MKTDAEILGEILATTANLHFADLLRRGVQLPDPPLDPLSESSTMTDLAGAAMRLRCRVEVRVVPFGEA